MKKLIICALICAFSVVASSQAKKSFPGVTASQQQQLRTANKMTALPLPTWVPAGFKLEKIKSNLGPRVKIEDRSLVIVYSKTLPNGKIQRFALEAGFEGLGDLMYDGAKVIPSAFGKIYLLYEPNDHDEVGKKVKNFVMTEWFDVGKTAFHYKGMFGKEGDPALAMISLSDTQKILRSLQRF